MREKAYTNYESFDLTHLGGKDMTKPLCRVVVTGGAGQIAYSLLFRIANGDMLGKDQPVALHILDLPQMEQALEGVVMELNDCAFPLLQEIHFGSDPLEIFAEADYALFVGSKPRGPGMERGDLLTANGRIFVDQGQALNRVASPDVKVLVVGNPCNTNCLIAMHNAPKIPRRNFFAMTRLDQNRAVAQLATKAAVGVSDVKNLVIWGNHSSTQVPDFLNASIKGRAVPEVIANDPWLKGEFLETVQKRGAAIIAARGKSSAASAANAAIDTFRDLMCETPPGESFSVGVMSNGNPYMLEDNLIFSFPCRSKGNCDWEFIPGYPWDDFLKEKMQRTVEELMEEREIVTQMVTTV